MYSKVSWDSYTPFPGPCPPRCFRLRVRRPTARLCCGPVDLLRFEISGRKVRSLEVGRARFGSVSARDSALGRGGLGCSSQVWHAGALPSLGPMRSMHGRTQGRLARVSSTSRDHSLRLAEYRRRRALHSVPTAVEAVSPLSRCQSEFSRRSALH